MNITPGTKLGPYEIVGALGAGGMGEVFKARDTRLGRDVAVKVLPARSAGDEQALARFEREARAVAALNHPNILALFDIGRDGDTAFVVTELLEGRTLRDALNSGPIAARVAVEHARSMAEALAAAHDRGIVHRDLKPENIFLTVDGRLKVLDFGLAQIASGVSDASPSDQSTPAMTMMVTSPGLVVGTVGYMAPEQVRGQATDARTDIFAFGLVLYEMLTGARAFRGDTPADTMSAVLTSEPAEVSATKAAISPGIERIMRRCLEKVPGQRFQSARDLSFALEAVATGTSTTAAIVSTGRLSRGLLAVAAGVAVVAVAAAAAFALGRRSVPASSGAPAARFLLAAGATVGPPIVSASPDGRYVIYSSPSTDRIGSSGTVIWLRRLDGLEARAIGGSGINGIPVTGLNIVFWSPDSTRIAFSNGEAIHAMSVEGGPPRRIGALPELPRSAAWGARDVIVLSTAKGVYRMSAATGEVRQLARSEESANVFSVSRVSFLPGGERFLYNAAGKDEASSETRAMDLEGRMLGVVAKGATGAIYADGHLVYGANGSLYAQRFGAASLKTSGAASEIAPSVMQDWRIGRLFVSASDTGVLTYRAAPNLDVRFTWLDHAGRQAGALNSVGSFTNFSVSPDGTRIIASRRDPVTSRNQLWLIDAERDIATMVSPAEDEGYGDPTWMPDGEHIVFRYQNQMALRSANGGERRVLLPTAAGYPDSVSRDGRFVLYGASSGPEGYGLRALDITSPGATPIALAVGPPAVDEGRFSPNGRWVAYASNESGPMQISMIPFPPTGERWQISKTGGVQPRWSKDGQELFYLDLEGRMMSVKAPDSDPRRASAPSVLFMTGLVSSTSLDQFEPVGDRFLLRMPASANSETAPVGIVTNWTQLVK